MTSPLFLESGSYSASPTFNFISISAYLRQVSTQQDIDSSSIIITFLAPVVGNSTQGGMEEFLRLKGSLWKNIF